MSRTALLTAVIVSVNCRSALGQSDVIGWHMAQNRFHRAA
jgi:hypothetical protein